MGRPGTSKARSIDHEEHVARRYGGRRSPSSGASFRDIADVDTIELAIECKETGGPGEDPISKPRFIGLLEKLADQAYPNGKDPVLALRFYLPDSALADLQGWVDVAIRPLDVDVEHEAHRSYEER